MKISKLQLKNFRNYPEKLVEFCDGLNVLVGKNASGKTNMLESIYMLGVGKSPRAVKEKELVKFGETTAYIKAELKKEHRKHRLEVTISENGKKCVNIDSLPITRMGELLGVLNVVYFSPDEMRLIKDSPDYRRRFLDISLSQGQRLYFIALVKYNKIIKQRNILLKTQNLNQNLDTMLDIWDEQLAEHGEIIINKRVEFLKALSVYAASRHKTLSEEKEDIGLEYETNVSLEGDVKANLLSALKADREKDKKLQHTNSGPHRDDIKITINTLDARKFASQGQQRTIALALKIGECDFFKAESGEYPVLLLDDVLSELDAARQNLLLDIVGDLQVILSCTEFNLNPKAKLQIIKIG